MSNDDSDVESGDSGDEGAEMITPIDIPDKPAFLDANATAPVPFNVEKDCAFLLLEARMILRAIMEHRLRQERILSGNLTVDEIQNLLRSQKEDSDKDWITRMSIYYIYLYLDNLYRIYRNPGVEEEIGCRSAQKPWFGGRLAKAGQEDCLAHQEQRKHSRSTRQD
jgi:hypothetical protein